jgi:HK97 family phage prohead protease
VIGLGVHTKETGATGSKSRTGHQSSQNEEKIMAKPLDKFVTRGDFLRADEESRKVRFRASTPTIDRHGTIVRPEGISVKNFRKNPIFLWGHDGYGSMLGGGPEMENVIGKVTDYERSKEAFDIDVEFAPAEVNPKADLAYKLVKDKFLNTVSVGFRPTKTSVEEIDKKDVLVYEKSELLEVSLVPIPSNPEALALVRSMAQEVNDTTPPWMPYLSSSSNLTDDGTYEIIINFGSESDPPASPEDSADTDVVREIRREIQKWLLRQSLRS